MTSRVVFPCKQAVWLLTPKFDGRQCYFLNSTCDMEPTDMRQGFQKYSDMRQGYFLNLTCDMAINERQRHATLAFLKIDRRHGEPPSRAPAVDEQIPEQMECYFVSSSAYRHTQQCLTKASVCSVLAELCASASIHMYGQQHEENTGIKVGFIPGLILLTK